MEADPEGDIWIKSALILGSCVSDELSFARSKYVEDSLVPLSPAKVF